MVVSTELPKELEEFVDEEVKRGRYNSKSELLRDALRLKMIERKFNLRGITRADIEKLDKALENIKD